MSHIESFFHAISGSPRPFEIDSLFGRGNAGYTYTTNTSELLQQLVQQVQDQGTVLGSLVSAVSGKSGGSAVESVLGGASFGGSVLGGIAGAAKGGFSLGSVLSDIFPVGGLISDIAGLFDSAPTPPPLDQYAAPPSLNFDAVLNANGTLSQGSANQYGFTRASEPGLSLQDAEGGPNSPYGRAPDGSLVPVAGNPSYYYGANVNLPDLVANYSRPAYTPAPANSAPSSTSFSAFSENGQPVSASTVSPGAPSAAGFSSTGSSATSDTTNEPPTFDQHWFNDHGSLIASAVRTQLLNFHPIVDTINNL